MRVGVKMRRKMARCNVNNVFEIRSSLPGCVDAFSFVSFSPGIFFLNYFILKLGNSYILNYN